MTFLNGKKKLASNSLASFTCKLHLIKYASQQRENFIYFILSFVDKGENAMFMIPVLLTADYTQLWFRRFRSGNFHVERCAPGSQTRRRKHWWIRTSKPSWPARQQGGCNTGAQELKMDWETVLNRLCKAGFRGNAPHWSTAWIGRERALWADDYQLRSLRPTNEPIS